jgi:hypothetical protein
MQIVAGRSRRDHATLARANFVFAGGEVAPSFVLHELPQLIEVLKRDVPIKTTEAAGRFRVHTRKPATPSLARK